jgi:hypothetical protein
VTGRVAPTLIKAYHFLGRGIYAHNPYDPTQTPQEGYSFYATWIENHEGRHNFAADLILSLPHDQTKLLFVPHVLHAVRIQNALKKKLNERLGDMTKEEFENFTPHIVHSGKNEKSRFQMTDAEREDIVEGLMAGRYKTVFSTDFLSTGFDTNQIDHVIDASGEKAIIKNLQRSGRGTRPRTNPDGSPKINNVHIILDKTHTALHKLGENKLSMILDYYGHSEFGPKDPSRLGGFLRYKEAPWIPKSARRTQIHGEGPSIAITNEKVEDVATFSLSDW